MPEFTEQRKKPPQSARPFAEHAKAGFQQQAGAAPYRRLSFLVPKPFQSQPGRNYLPSVVADFAVVSLNWLALGALLVPLRHLFPFVWSFGYSKGSPASLLGVALLHASLLTLIGHIEGLYSAADPRAQRRILSNAVLWSTGLLVLTYGMEGAAWTRCALCGAAGLLHFGLLSFWRSPKRRSRERDTPTSSRNVLVVGAGSLGRQVAAGIRSAGRSERSLCGFLDDEVPLGDGVIGRVGDLPRLARSGFVDEIILVAPREQFRTLEILREARRLHLDMKLVPDLSGCGPAESEVEMVGDVPLISLHTEKHPAVRLLCKRVLDILGAALALVFLSPVFALIGILIVLDSPGPVFYSAQRAGRKARPFRCYKFRTMVADADELKQQLRQVNQRSGPFFKIYDDPRVTRVGRFLRRYSLDELPQLWNVVRGEMSLVGPRPHPLDDFAGYETEHLARLDVTPGITGLWQVTARRDPSFERGMDLDREYIGRWSLALDFWIMLKTLMAVVRGGGD